MGDPPRSSQSDLGVHGEPPLDIPGRVFGRERAGGGVQPREGFREQGISTHSTFVAPRKPKRRIPTC